MLNLATRLWPPLRCGGGSLACCDSHTSFRVLGFYSAKGEPDHIAFAAQALLLLRRTRQGTMWININDFSDKSRVARSVPGLPFFCAGIDIFHPARRFSFGSSSELQDVRRPCFADESVWTCLPERQCGGRRRGRRMEDSGVLRHRALDEIT